MIFIFHLGFHFTVALLALLLSIGFALHVFNSTASIPSEDVSDREGA
jgi:hypothetical protein